MWATRVVGNEAGNSKPVQLVSGGAPGVIAAMEFMLEIFGELFIALDGFALIADVYAWMKGKDNRIERRAARQQGRTPPPRDNWNRWVIGLSVTFLVLTTGLIVWKF
jgi:hypothetical protein